MAKPVVIISTNFELTESQNFLRYSKAQNRLLSVAFAFQLVAFAFSLLLVGAAQAVPEVGQAIVAFPYLFLASGTLLFSVGYTLGYSKIAARKSPLNYALLLAFQLCLAHFLLGGDWFLFERTLPALLAMFVLSAAVNLLYLAFLRDYYSGTAAFLAVLGPLIAAFALSGFLYQRDFLLLASYFVFASLAALLTCLGAEGLMKNKDYNLLKDDYVLVALKLITVFPLLPHLVDEERSGEDE